MVVPQNKNRVKVTAQELRTRFNRDVQPRIDNKTYTVNPVIERPAPKEAHQLPGSKSTMFEVLDNTGNKVAFAHVYVRPDGTYGGSGRLDPKYVKNGQITYFTSD